jgi:hypothetical protein
MESLTLQVDKSGVVHSSIKDSSDGQIAPTNRSSRQHTNAVQGVSHPTQTSSRPAAARVHQCNPGHPAHAIVDEQTSRVRHRSRAASPTWCFSQIGNFNVPFQGALVCRSRSIAHRQTGRNKRESRETGQNNSTRKRGKSTSKLTSMAAYHKLRHRREKIQPQTKTLVRNHQPREHLRKIRPHRFVCTHATGSAVDTYAIRATPEARTVTRKTSQVSVAFRFRTSIVSIP